MTDNNKRPRNKRNSFIPSKVIGVRAECELWDRCDKVAIILNTTRNDVIVKAVIEYIKDKEECDNGKKCF